MKNKEITKLTNDELASSLNKIKKDLFNMRFKRTNGPIEDTSKFSALRKDVAKILTKLNKKKKK
jgi:large subunit ribosomal protein L29|tara:strand:+ start:51 stop:242 length:192 start_codon:yes stop_codon:yes gene_type:complete